MNDCKVKSELSPRSSVKVTAVKFDFYHGKTDISYCAFSIMVLSAAKKMGAIVMDGKGQCFRNTVKPLKIGMMALKYRAVKHKLPRQEDKYYARACNRYKVTIDDLAELISRSSSASRADVVLVLTALTDLVPSLLLDNKLVQLGELGTVSLHLNSEGEATEEAVTWRSIKNVRVRFRAGMKFKKQLSDLRFKKVKE